MIAKRNIELEQEALKYMQNINDNNDTSNKTEISSNNNIPRISRTESMSHQIEKLQMEHSETIGKAPEVTRQMSEDDQLQAAIKASLLEAAIQSSQEQLEDAQLEEALALSIALHKEALEKQESM